MLALSKSLGVKAGSGRSRPETLSGRAAQPPSRINMRGAARRSGKWAGSTGRFRQDMDVIGNGMRRRLCVLPTCPAVFRPLLLLF
ncbi:hypothetical protein GCM10027019_12250 [Melaminivora jejuensis]